MDPQPVPASPSPRSRPDAAWDDTINPLPSIPAAASKLRLMCSYGGHIIPRPHDKSLCYVGGDTRIVVADRRSSLSELHSRLSQTLLNGRQFTLKYQLPAEDLDSLISLATDEDLDNMIEEYDRTATTTTSAAAASPLKPPSRLRLFLFPSKPETAASMGSLLDDAKSETWFVDALNGAGFLPRGLSESAAIDNLLDLEPQNDNSSLGNNDKQVVGKSNCAQTQLEVAALDSPPMVETSSSFGSSSSSPSMANLPPIKVRVGEGCMMMAGLDEQLSHVSIAGENGSGRVICDDDKSDGRLRKPPLPLQTAQRKLVDIHSLPSPDSKHGGPNNFPSPNSVASDCSIASSTGSLSKHNTIHQDAAQQQQHMNRDNTNKVDPKPMTSNIPQGSIQHQTDPVPVPHPHQQQQQQHFIHPHNYIHHPYYPMYLQPQTQQPVQHQPDQPYPMYLLPPNNTVPNYPTTKPDMGANIHPGAGSGATPVYMQVPTNQYQHQQQYANAANYGYEYNPHHHMADQLYYGRQMATSAAPPPLQPSQYQTMTSAAAVMLSQSSRQVAADSSGQQQS